MRAGPERRRGRRRASFDVVVENRGNSPDGDRDRRRGHRGALPHHRHPRAHDGAGRRRPPRRSCGSVCRYPLIFARPVDHRLSVTHQASGVEAEHEPSRVTFQQRPWLPWWVPPAIGLIAAFIVVVLMLRPPPRGPQPDGAQRRERDEGAQEVTTSRSVDTTYETSAEGHRCRLDHRPGARAGRGDHSRHRGHHPRRAAGARARPGGDRAHARAARRTRSQRRTWATTRNRPTPAMTGS